MFNGIKSILFGYSSEDITTETNSNVNNSTGQQNPIHVSKEASVFEQTLNAATTKLTEQLLPRCPSIEQLQSSSHQLLPTLNEQHEEDEFRKRKLNEVVVAGDSIDDDDDDDDGFNADSWELLDLVEKQPVSSTDDKQIQANCNKTSGILKLNNSPTSLSSNEQTNESAVGTQKRQNKPKVSFETPDLVKETKEKIERKTPKENVVIDKDHPRRKYKPEGKLRLEKYVSEKEKKNRNKHKKITGSNNDNEEIGLFCGELFPEIAADNNVEKLVESREKVEVSQLEACKIVKPQPVLNYAAALSMKLNKTSVDESERKKEVLDEYSRGPDLASSSKIEGSLKKNGAVKRNRPVSFSSSCYENEDDDDDCEIAWDDLSGPTAGINDFDGKCKKWQDDENDSIISSGFSDCDYGYEGLNDIVMRPRKSSGKKRRSLSNSHKTTLIVKRDSVSRESVTKKALIAAGSTMPERKNSTGSDKDTPKTKFSVSSKNNIKPKKKKIILSSSSMSTSSYDFMKNCSSNEAKQQKTSATSEEFKLMSPSSEEAQTMRSRSSTTTCRPVLSSHLMPPPQPYALAGSNTNSGNDSSDIADMDESWYVTPPPCFTGSNRFNKSKVPKLSKSKEADRENALIEHPSIYIASTSKQQQEVVPVSNGNFVETSKELATKSSSNNNQVLSNKQKPIVLRKVGKTHNLSASDFDDRRKSTSLLASSSSSSLTPISSSSSALKPHPGKKDVKAWENKFIVKNWGFDDEQEDVNEDFDNLFDVSDKCSSPNVQPCKTKKSSFKLKKKVSKKKDEPMMKLSSPSDRKDLQEISPGYESDEFSIPSPALMDEIGDSLSDMSLGEVVPTPNSLVLISSNDASSGAEENEDLKAAEKKQVVVWSRRANEESVVAASSEKKAPTQVRPIEPERKPSWQLRRKRSKHNPLSSISNTYNAASGGGVKLTAMKSLSNKQQMMLTTSSSNAANRSASRSSGGSSNFPSSCSSPTLIDHMSSIVANLTSGFTATSSSLPFQARSSAAADVECSDKSNEAAITLARSEQSNMDAVSRRRMSKSYLNRQNNCAKLGNMNRRSDRRMKMHTTPNGYSINRKVHTNFH